MKTYIVEINGADFSEEIMLEARTKWGAMLKAFLLHTRDPLGPGKITFGNVTRM